MQSQSFGFTITEVRFKVLQYFFILTTVVIIIRLFYWQVIRFDELSSLADKQHLVSFKTEGERGIIYSSDGSILAANKPTYLLFAMPKVIKNKEEVARKLAPFLEKSIQTSSDNNGSEEAQEDKVEFEKEILKNLSKDLYWVPLYKKLDFNTKKEIEQLKIDGIGFEGSLNRFYPEASSAAHILGFVGSNSLGEQFGYFGVEGFYNGSLRGRGGTLIEEKDAFGLPILSGKFLQKDAKKGYNLTLNIDRTVQYIVEKKLKDGIIKYGAKSASAIVLDPKSGAVLAMASLPVYDPNNYQEFPKEYFKNPLVADFYEPGSTFKVLVMAAALNEGVVKADTKCDICHAPISIAGYTIRTWNNKYSPDSTMTDVIVHSDNTGMVFAAKKLGIDKFYNYLQSFGLGKPTDIDLQDESVPELRSKNGWKEIDLATASFGQGIAFTSLQVVRAVGAIANKGNLMEPHILNKFEYEGKVTEIKPKVAGKPISEEAAKEVTKMMVEAVEKGEARVFAPKGFKIAGKTGTAQIPVAGHYDPNKTIASFVGFAPADDPKFVMLVRFDEPSSSIFGSETAAPTFFEIAKELFVYYKIAPNQ